MSDRTVRLSGGPHNGRELLITGNGSILYLPVGSQPERFAVYIERDAVWKFGGFAPEQFSKLFTPSSLNQLLVYLTDHPRVRRYADHLPPRETRFIRYTHGAILWSDGTFHPITSSRSNDYEWGLEFDPLGFTYAFRSMRYRYEYLP